MSKKNNGGRPLKFKSVKELQKKIDAYFEYCDKEKKPYTVSGLAVYLECDRDTLLNYQDKEEYFGTIKGAKNKILAYAEEKLYTQNVVTGIIFSLKNNYGWADKQEVTSNVTADINSKVDLSNLSTEEIKKLLEEK